MSEENSNHKGNKTIYDVPISILDLAPIVAEATAADSFHHSLDLAQHAEKWGYNRYWLAEHHNMPGIASSATSLVIGYIAQGTERIRVGSGGIMLPNHAPLIIAEQFGTLESLYPGRIDLGLGRAPGSDQAAMRAIRRGLQNGGEDFPELVDELRSYFEPYSESKAGRVRAVPGEGLNIPIWLLGSSGFSARLAAELGLPFAFASHFAPDYLLPALQLYRENFRPSDVLKEPYAMVGINVIAADTDEEARKLHTSQQQQFLNLIRGRTGKLNRPVLPESMETIWTEYEKSHVEKMLAYSAVGNKSTIRDRLSAMLDETGADEWIAAGQIFDHQARLRSYEILAEAVKKD